MQREIEGRSLKNVRGAVRSAAQYAEEKGVPLTAERLAAALSMPVTEFYALVKTDKPAGISAEVLHVLRDAFAEANASVIEHALTRGSSTTMHAMYLRQYAGYGQEAAAEDGVRFCGEQEII